VSDELEAVKIAGDWAKQLSLWATGALVLSLGFLKDFLQGRDISALWWWCLLFAWLLLIFCAVCGHLALGAPLTNAGKVSNWTLEINDQVRTWSRFQLISFVVGLVFLVTFVAFHLSDQADSLQSGWVSAGCVGPFISGASSELQQQPNTSELNRCRNIASFAEPIRKSCKGERTCTIMLLGSSDKRRLNKETEANFGSNEGLARARAEWVRTEFVRAFALDPSHFIIFTIGPGEHGATIDEERFQVDRAVQVFVTQFASTTK